MDHLEDSQRSGLQQESDFNTNGGGLQNADADQDLATPGEAETQRHDR